VVHSAAKLYASPGEPFWRAFLAASAASMPAASPEGLSKQLWALARLGHQPPACWLDAWMARSGEQLEAFTAQVGGRAQSGGAQPACPACLPCLPAAGGNQGGARQVPGGGVAP
jgi:hypothetical protein